MISTDNLRVGARERGLPVDDMAMLRQALTHKSLVPHNPLASNERLEFLGDAVLGLVINEFLYGAFPHRKEGDLAKAKALIVCQSSLAEASRRLDILPLLQLGRPEEAMGGRNRASLAADAYEAVVAVIYLDRGYKAVQEFILRSLAEEIEQVNQSTDWRDAKTALQELRQGIHASPPVYRVAEEQGMPHDRTFVVEVVIDDEVAGTGVGKSKREAEQAAAEVALTLLR
ncbi:MAG: ribonuclease III [Capsulimonadaceae bacterium]